MRTIFFIVILVLNFVIDAGAQLHSLARFDVDFYNPSANLFFDRYNNVDHVAILYRKGEAEIIDIYFKGKDKPIFSERYVLSFDGDMWLLNKKYKQFLFPNNAKAKLTYLKGIQKLDEINVIHDFRTTLRRDSLTYHFRFHNYVGNRAPSLGPVNHQPRFKGDVLKLTSKLEQSFKQWQPLAVTDSLIIVSGTVDRKGIIGPLKLIEGRSSNYTKNILDFMSKEATSWWPKFDGGGARPWPVRISVRVNKDGSLKVSIL